jgi:hypothetical protein
MKTKEKNIITKAGVLLIASVMILSILPAITADSEETRNEINENALTVYQDSTYRPGRYDPNINHKNVPDIPYSGSGSFAEGDTIFQQLPISSSHPSWSIPFSDITYGSNQLIVFDDFAVTQPIGGMAFWCLEYLGDDTFMGATIEVAFWNDVAGMPDYGGVPVASFIGTVGVDIIEGPGGDTFVGYPTLYMTYDFPAGQDVNMASGWISVQKLSPADGTALAWLPCDPSTGTGMNYIAWQYSAGVPTRVMDANNAEFFDMSLELFEGAGGGPGPVGDCIEDVCDFEIVALNQAYMYEGKINELPQIINVTVRNNGEVGINEVKLLADVYEKICGDTHEKYCDPKYDLRFWEMETADNFTVIDDDPVEGDSWVLQGGPDNRWVTNNQAWRCTAGEDRSYGGDLDTYLGLSDDAIGTDDLIFDPVDPICKNDLAGAACATFTFKHWAEGEYTFDSDGNVIPVDFGTLSYCLNGTGIWTDIPKFEFVAYDTDGEWQEVTIKFINETYYNEADQPWKVPYKEICPDCEPGEDDIVVMTEFPADARLQFRWSWHKDPCYNFEGWYIDEICLTRTEKYYLELIHQAHLIFPMDGCDPEHGPVNIYKEFELGWDPDPDTWYQIDICGQVFSPSNCEFDTENNCWHTQFYVTDIHDVMCVDMELLTLDPDVGDPVSANITIKNIGTFAEDDVPVVLKIADCVVSSPADDDFETDPSGRWSFGYFIGRAAQNFFRWTKGDATIDGIGDGRSILPGSESMTASEEQPTYPRIPENAGCLMETGSAYDFSDVQSATLEFYLKYSIDDVNSVGDYFAIYFHPLTGPDSPWWSAINDHVWTGYTNDFIFVSIDLKARAEMFEYEEGGETIIPEVEFAFTIFTDDNDGETVHPSNPIPWSGAIFDNVIMKIVSCGGTSEEVATVTSGTLAPGEEETLVLTWPEAEVCNHCLIGDVNLATDVDTTNDMCSVCVSVTEFDELDEFSSEDLTGRGDCLWHLCDSRGGGDDTYAWAGVEEEHWAHYVHDMDDALISPPINMTAGAALDGVAVNFSTWYKFYNADDFGKVYARANSSDYWHKLNGAFIGYGGEHFNDVGGYEGFYIPPELCQETTQIMFRMVSDPADTGYDPENDVSEGWYIDDVEIVEVIDSNPGSFGSFADTWYAFGTGYTWPTEGPGQFPELDPANYINLGPNLAPDFIAGACWYEDEWVGCVYGTGELWNLGTDGTMTFRAPGGGTGLQDICVHGGTMYGTSGSALYEVDPDTGVSTMIGSHNGPTVMIGIGSDETNIYGVDIGTDNTYTIDPGTGAATLLGASGHAMGYAQDSAVDKASGEYYHAAYYSGGLDYLTKLNKNTGQLETIDTFPLVEITGFAIPGAGAGGGEMIYGDTIWSDDFERENIAPWQCQKTAAGDYWKYYATSGYLPEPADPAEDYWVCHGYPGTGKGLNNVLYTELDLTTAPAFDDLTHAELKFRTAWKMEAGCEAFIEISTDWDGTSPQEDSTWVTFWHHEGGDNTNWLTSAELVNDDRFVLNQYIGNVIYLRFRYTTPGEGFSVADFHGWAIDDVTIEFKSEAFEDNEPPVTSICFDTVTGEVTLLAVDYPIPKGSGVKATYFKIDGGATETYVGSFLLGEGSHTVEFWSEDNAGNVESHKTRTYVLDTTPPEVELTSPEDGKLYLFGSPIMDRILGSGTLCIGSVPVAASATDEGAGVALVMFAFDNGDSGFDDDGSDGFTYDYRGMHFGALTITATAVDEGGLMSTPDSMTITVYSLGLM